MTKVKRDQFPTLSTTQPTVPRAPFASRDKAFVTNKEIEATNSAEISKKKTNQLDDLDISMTNQPKKKASKKGPKGSNEKQNATSKSEQKITVKDGTTIAKKSVKSITANVVTVNQKKGSQEPKKMKAPTPLEVSGPKIVTSESPPSINSLASKTAGTAKLAVTAGKKGTKAPITKNNTTFSDPKKQPMNQSSKNLTSQAIQDKFAKPVDEVVSDKASDKSVPSSDKLFDKMNGTMVVDRVSNTTKAPGTGEVLEDNIAMEKVTNKNLTETLDKPKGLAESVPIKQKKEQVTTKQGSGKTKVMTPEPIDEAVSLEKTVPTKGKFDSKVKGNWTASSSTAAEKNGQSDEVATFEDVANTNATDTLETDEVLADFHPTKQPKKQSSQKQGLGKTETKFSEPVNEAISDKSSAKSIPAKGKKSVNVKETTFAVSDGNTTRTVDIDEEGEDSITNVQVTEKNVTETPDQREDPTTTGISKQPEKQVATKKGRGNSNDVNAEQIAEEVSDTLEPTVPSSGNNASMVPVLTESASGMTEGQDDTQDKTKVIHTNVNKTNASVGMENWELTNESSTPKAENGGITSSSKSIKTNSAVKGISETLVTFDVVKTDVVSNSSSLSNEVDLTETEAEMVEGLLQKFNVSQSEAFGNATIFIIGDQSPREGVQPTILSNETIKSIIPTNPGKDSTSSDIEESMEQYNSTMQNMITENRTNVTNITPAESIDDDAVAANSSLIGNSTKLLSVKLKLSNLTENKTAIDINESSDEDIEIIDTNEGASGGDDFVSGDEREKTAEVVDSPEEVNGFTQTSEPNGEGTTTNNSVMINTTLPQSSMTKEPLVESTSDDEPDDEDGSDPSTWNTTDMDTGNLFSGTGPTGDYTPEVKVGNSTLIVNAGVEMIESTTSNATLDESNSEGTDDATGSDTDIDPDVPSNLVGSGLNKTVVGTGGSSNTLDTINDESLADENETESGNGSLNALNEDSKDTGTGESQAESGNEESKTLSGVGNHTVPVPANTDLTHITTAKNATSNATSVGETSASEAIDTTVISSDDNTNTAENQSGNHSAEVEKVEEESEDESESGSTSGLSSQVGNETNKTVGMETAGTSKVTAESSTSAVSTVGGTGTFNFDVEEEDDEHSDEDGEDEGSTDTDTYKNGDLPDGASPIPPLMGLPVTTPSPRLEVPVPVASGVPTTRSPVTTPSPTPLTVSSMFPGGSPKSPTKSLPIIKATDDDVSFGSGGLLIVVLLAMVGAVFLWFVRNRSKLSFVNHRQGYQRLEYKQDANISKKN